MLPPTASDLKRPMSCNTSADGVLGRHTYTSPEIHQRSLHETGQESNVFVCSPIRPDDAAFDQWRCTFRGRHTRFCPVLFAKLVISRTHRLIVGFELLLNEHHFLCHADRLVPADEIVSFVQRVNAIWQVARDTMQQVPPTSFAARELT